MKVFLIIICISLLCSCCIKKDIMPAPSEYGYNNLLIDNTIGINSFTNSNNSIPIQTIGEGWVNVSGLNECELSKSIRYTSKDNIFLSLKDMFIASGCVFNIVNVVDGFDAPIIGKILVKEFIGDNILPLKTKIKKIKYGTNETQIKKDSQVNIKIYPTGSYGFINISGCDLGDEVETFIFDNEKEISLDLNLFSKPCVLEILVNNSDYVKEESLVYISVYNQSQDKINAPLISNTSDGICFKFKDKYVVGIIVNNVQKIFNKSFISKKVCTKTLPAKVIGFTSNFRMFYGVYDGNNWNEF